MNIRGEEVDRKNRQGMYVIESEIMIMMVCGYK